MSLFSDTEPTQYTNFTSVPYALVTLFSVFTNNWIFVLQDTYIDCPEPPPMGGEMVCERYISPCIYLISFLLLGTYMMLNLIIAVVIEKFVENASREGLLQTDTFFDILRRKMIMDRFVAQLKQKVQEAQAREAEQMAERSNSSVGGIIQQTVAPVVNSLTKTLSKSFSNVKRTASASYRSTNNSFERQAAGSTPASVDERVETGGQRNVNDIVSSITSKADEDLDVDIEHELNQIETPQASTTGRPSQAVVSPTTTTTINHNGGVAPQPKVVH